MLFNILVGAFTAISALGSAPKSVNKIQKIENIEEAFVSHKMRAIEKNKMDLNSFNRQKIPSPPAGFVSSSNLGSVESDLFAQRSCKEYGPEWIRIFNRSDFQKFYVYENWTRPFVLCSNIDFHGENLTPIPVYGGWFDGNGHVLSNFRVIKSLRYPGDNQTAYSGLFDFLWGADIKNLQLKDFHIEGYVETGGLASYALLTDLQNIKVEGTSRSAAIAGLVVGALDLSTASNIWVKGELKSFELGAAAFGAIVKSDISNIHIQNTRVETGAQGGGVFGYNKYSNLNGCTVTTTVSPVDPHDVQEVIDSTGLYPEAGHWLGGIGGFQEFVTFPDYQEDAPVIVGCVVSASVAGEESLGGVMGQNYGDEGSRALIANSRVRAKVHGIRKLGGLVGDARYTEFDGVGVVAEIIGDEEVGGVLGYANYLNDLKNMMVRADLFSDSRTGSLVGKLEASDVGYYYGNLSLYPHYVVVTGGVSDDAIAGEFINNVDGARLFMSSTYYNSDELKSDWDNAYVPNDGSAAKTYAELTTYPGGLHWFDFENIWKQLDGQLLELRDYEDNPYDLNHDNRVNTEDLEILIGREGFQSSPLSYGNLNEDNIIDKTDLLLFVSYLSNL